MSASNVNKPYAAAGHTAESLPAKASNHREKPEIEEKKESLRALHRNENHSDLAIKNRATGGRKGGSGSSANYGSTHSSLQASHGAGGPGIHPHDTDKPDDLVGKKPSEPRAGPTLAEKLVHNKEDVGSTKRISDNESSDTNDREGGNVGSGGSVSSSGLLRTPAAELVSIKSLSEPLQRRRDISVPLTNPLYVP